MSGIFVERKNYVHLANAAYDLIADMLANGFTQRYPSTPFTKPAAATPFAPLTVVLEAGATIDPLNATQPWMIRIDLTTEDKWTMDATAPSQINLVDGTIQYQDAEEKTNALLWDRSDRAANFNAWPLSYVYSATARGFAFSIWENDQDKLGNNFATFVVQRPVNKTTGAALVAPSSKCPVFALAKRRSDAEYTFFVVREVDVMRPTKRQSAEVNGVDSNRIINAKKQVCVTEDGKYIIDFPCRLNSPRYLYTEELDMVGVTSADIVSQGSAVPTTVYGEGTPRNYYALNANGADNTGMRLMVLKSGGGIS